MLRFDHVTKVFNPGTPDEKVAINDITLHIKKGDFVSIIGANGAGKSTLFNAVCGSFLVDKGAIWLAGRDITLVQEHFRARVIGRLFQDPMRGTAPDMSIEENLALAARRGEKRTLRVGITREDMLDSANAGVLFLSGDRVLVRIFGAPKEYDISTRDNGLPTALDELILRIRDKYSYLYL